jgi:hypothetical protein
MTVEYDTRKISVDPPIYIYKRIDERGRVSRNWTYRFQVRFNPNPIRRSARTNDFEKAKRIALGAYYEAEHRVSTGKPIKKVSFGELCDDYVATLKGTKRSYYEGVIRRFLKPFFGKQLSDVSDLRQRHIVEYERWRQAYWTEGEGSTRSRFRYERNGKRIEAPVQNRGEPSANTWNREATVLRRLIEYAVDRELISRTDRPKVKSKPVEKRQRPHFTSQQWSKLHSVARAWIREASTEKQRETRQVLYDFIMFVANSGLVIAHHPVVMAVRTERR